MGKNHNNRGRVLNELQRKQREANLKKRSQVLNELHRTALTALWKDQQVAKIQIMSCISDDERPKFINSSYVNNKLRKYLKSMEAKDGKQVSMNGKHTEKAADADPVYKFTPEAYKALNEFLGSRPMRETLDLHKAFFRHGKEDPYYTHVAITRLLDYIMSCPLSEAEGIATLLNTSGLLQFVPSTEKPADGKESTEETPTSEASETTDTPAQ